MEIKLRRIYRGSKYTIGKLYVVSRGKEIFVSDTIEDVDRLYYGKPKIKGETAIPCGRYEIVQNVFSNRFGNKTFYKNLCNGYLPRLLNVPQFEGVLIHCGNYAGYETFFKKVPVSKNKQVLSVQEYVDVV